MSRPDVLILGGGIIGLACARELVRRGRSVELVEGGRLGAAASSAAAGMLAPLAEVPDSGPFLNVCRESRDLWRGFAAELTEETGLDLDADRSGVLLFDPDDPGRPERLLALARKLGEPAELRDGDALRREVPDVRPGIDRAVWLGGEHRVDNRKVCEALVQHLGHAGVHLRQGFHVTGVRLSESGVVLESRDGERAEASRLVVAAGAWSGAIPGFPELPVRPVRGQMLELGEVDWPFSGSVWAGDLYTVRRAGRRLLVGATVEEAGWSTRPTPRGIAELLDALRRFFPALADRPLLDTWAGLRPAAPDLLPILGRVDKVAVVATAHYRNGILLAPWTALAVAELLDGGAEDPTFSPGRFADFPGRLAEAAGK